MRWAGRGWARMEDCCRLVYRETQKMMSFPRLGLILKWDEEYDYQASLLSNNIE
jgi:hypothetical protein